MTKFYKYSWQIICVVLIVCAYLLPPGPLVLMFWICAVLAGFASFGAWISES